MGVIVLSFSAAALDRPEEEEAAPDTRLWPADRSQRLSREVAAVSFFLEPVFDNVEEEDVETETEELVGAGCEVVEEGSIAGADDLKRSE